MRSWTSREEDSAATGGRRRRKSSRETRALCSSSLEIEWKIVDVEFDGKVVEDKRVSAIVRERSVESIKSSYHLGLKLKFLPLGPEIDENVWKSASFKPPQPCKMTALRTVHWIWGRLVWPSCLSD